MAGYYERTPEHKEKHRQACLGKTGKWKRTDEQKAKTSAALKGREMTNEHKEALSKALVKRWENGDLKSKFSKAIEERKENKERVSRIPERDRLARKKEKNGNWRGGVCEENRLARENLEYKNWRKSVFERDGYVCKKCGASGVFLEAHHIKTFSKYPHLRHERLNGITLCKPCHKKTKKREEEFEEEFIDLTMKLEGLTFAQAIKRLT